MVRFPVLSRVSGAVTSGIEIYRYIRDHSPDVVLLYGVPSVGVQTLLSARRFQTPVIFRSIDILDQLVPSKALIPATKALERYVYNRAVRVVTVTLHLKNYIESFGVPEARVRVLPSGVDSTMFSPGPRNDRLLSAWGIQQGDPVILFMGTIYKFCGLDRIIRDFPGLLARHPRSKLLIVGCGEGEAALKALAIQVGVSGNVVFGGLHPYAALPDIIRSSDVCINPFELNPITRDILPTKLFQYLACKKPVVATPLPGTMPFLSGEEHGMIYCSQESFVDCVADLLDDPRRQELLGGKGVAVTTANYDWKRIAETMIGWMREVTDQSRQNR
jgi:glycosyltransferase involved in cell wall biosynthesis